MPLIKEIIKNKEQIKQWRHELHAIPEIAFEEFKTAEFVEQKLQSFGLTIYPRMAGTGVIASITAGNNKKSIALRADMDALPIIEKNKLDYCSKHKGKMHACGHDGHTSMLLGAAQYLSQHQNFNGTVYFIFQPAEENEGGGKKLVEEGFFKKFPVDAVYGMHNWRHCLICSLFFIISFINGISFILQSFCLINALRELVKQHNIFR